MAHPLPSLAQQPRHYRPRRLLWPLTPHPTRNAYILLFTDRFSRRDDMFANSAAQFTAAGTADVFIDKYITCLLYTSPSPRD